MVTSHNIVKKRKESVKALRNLNGKNAKQKLRQTSEKLGAKMKRDANTHPQTVHIEDDLRGKLKKSQLGNRNVIKKGAKEISTINKSTVQFPKRSNRQSEKIFLAKSEKHVDSNHNLESEGGENTKRMSHNVSTKGLKRKRPNNDDVESSKNIASGENVVSKAVGRKSLKRRKRSRVVETTDTLNLNDLSREHILQCISVIFHLTEEQLKSKNALFEGESQPIFMQVTCIRVPKTSRRNMRVLLPHSVVSPDDEVALFVGDLRRGRRQDFTPTVEHYEDLLRKHNCARVKCVIPMIQVKTEYDQYELKRKLVGSYDHFLADGKISGHLSHLLGKEFYKKRKLPTSIRMHSKDLKHEIEYALRKTTMQLHSSGDTHIIQVGHTSMEGEEILENVLAACSHLSKHYPGGWANIRSVRIKTATSLALPIYTTLKMKNSVKVPVVPPKRPKAYHDVQGELSTFSGDTVVTVTPEGVITVDTKEVETDDESGSVN
ncbi:ribosomal L1 domain-containing protein 1 [Andrena cerasifolii]|uniref:ribosomal L1 domain-containing protein 1 n=1 Tax=Andrena cerasifolii TaxID=2819439 RepID=UPI004037F8E2